MRIDFKGTRQVLDGQFDMTDQSPVASEVVLNDAGFVRDIESVFKGFDREIHLSQSLVAPTKA